MALLFQKLLLNVRQVLWVLSNAILVHLKSTRDCISAKERRVYLQKYSETLTAKVIKHKGRNTLQINCLWTVHSKLWHHITLKIKNLEPMKLSRV